MTGAITRTVADSNVTGGLENDWLANLNTQRLDDSSWTTNGAVRRVAPAVFNEIRPARRSPPARVTSRSTTRAWIPMDR